MMEDFKSPESDKLAMEVAIKLNDLMDQYKTEVIEKAIRFMAVGQRNKLLGSIQIAERNAGGSLS